MRVKQKSTHLPATGPTDVNNCKHGHNGSSENSWGLTCMAQVGHMEKFPSRNSAKCSDIEFVVVLLSEKIRNLCNVNLYLPI